MSVENSVTLASSREGGDEHDDCAAKRVEEALARHQGALQRFLVRALRPDEDAEDILQEIYTRLLKREREDGVKDYPRAYLFVTATNIIRDVRRRRYVREQANNDPLLAISIKSEVADPHPSAEATLVWKEGVEIVQEALRALNPKYVKVFPRACGLDADHQPGRDVDPH